MTIERISALILRMGIEFRVREQKQKDAVIGGTYDGMRDSRSMSFSENGY